MSSIRNVLGDVASEPAVFSVVVFLAVFTAALAIGRRWLLSTPEVPRRPASAADLARRPRGTALLNAESSKAAGRRRRRSRCSCGPASPTRSSARSA